LKIGFLRKEFLLTDGGFYGKIKPEKPRALCVGASRRGRETYKTRRMVQTMLEIRNITKIYRSKTGQEVRALDDVSITFPETGMVFILGKSGSGKSTLLNVIGGLDGYDAGEFIIKGKSSWDTVFGTGGMPSSHSAFVMAIAVSIGVLYGGRSPLFALAAAFALVVMYDAFNVRRAAGEHAKHINQMWEELREELQSVPAMEILKESLGHTPLQVIVGALLGSGVGALAIFFK
jgi:acid phosphatase family membrane protein YuiD